jgi:hypothetical protein
MNFYFQCVQTYLPPGIFCPFAVIGKPRSFLKNLHKL